jgi:hypothetical protein
MSIKSDRELINDLSTLIEDIQNETIPDDAKESLSNFLAGSKPDSEMLKYLFTGFWVWQNAKKLN